MNISEGIKIDNLKCRLTFFFPELFGSRFFEQSRLFELSRLELSIAGEFPFICDVTSDPVREKLD